MRKIDLSFAREAEGYTVSIGRGLLRSLPALISQLAPSKKCVVIGDSRVLTHYKSGLEEAFEATGTAAFITAFHASEPAKSLESISAFYHLLLQQRIERGTPLVAFGGGITGDVAGFVAASYLRGIPLFQVPTTLLAMVDASVGGKVGVNLPHGKNLVGAFYQPRAVIIDPEVLKTLPEREFRAGLSECIKHAIIKDEALFSWTEQNSAKISAREMEILEELIARNVAIKASVVMADEKERGERALLNLGHTFAHALEARTTYSVFLHGEAVSLGLMAAANLAGLVSGLSEEVPRRIEVLLLQLGLPVRADLPPSAELVEAMQFDKKVERDEIRFILPQRIGSAEIRKGIPAELILRAWDSIRER